MADKMREKNTIIICAMFFVTLIICGILFWPTLYRYDKTGGEVSRIVRINRITGYTEILYTSRGWESVKAEKAMKPLPIEDKGKITIRGDFDGKGHYTCSVYNGTNWNIKKIRLSIGTIIV